MKATRKGGAAATAAYIGAVWAANWTTAHHGPVPVWPGLAAVAGTYFAGAAFLVRDFIQEGLGRRAVFAAIIIGAALSAATSPSLALASGATFALSETADLAMFTPLRRHGFALAAAASNIVGGVIDTFVFLRLAGIHLTRVTVGGQLVGKAWASLAPVALIAVVSGYRSTRRRRLAEVAP